MAKEKQAVAQAEIKKLEKDMSEFKNNKEGKIEELRVNELLPSNSPTTDCSQANISKQKSAIQKHNVVMKTQQKETQTAQVELGKLPILFYRDFTDMSAEQLETDLVAADQAVVEIKATAEATRQELQDQYKQRDTTTVRIP
jgi:structural maintenance of chromosome 2